MHRPAMPPLLIRLMWFAGLWLAGVLALALVTWLLRLVLT